MPLTVSVRDNSASPKVLEQAISNQVLDSSRPKPFWQAHRFVGWGIFRAKSCGNPPTATEIDLGYRGRPAGSALFAAQASESLGFTFGGGSASTGRSIFSALGCG